MEQTEQTNWKWLTGDWCRWGHQSLQDFGVCCMRQMVSHLGPGPSHNGPNSGAQPTPNCMATLKHRPQGLQDTPSTETPGYDSTDAEQDMDASEPICTGWTYVMLQTAPVGPQSKLLIILSMAAPSTSALEEKVYCSKKETHKQTGIRQTSNICMSNNRRDICLWGCMSHLGFRIFDIKFKLCREFVIGVQSVTEIHPPNATVCMDLREKTL